MAVTAELTIRNDLSEIRRVVDELARLGADHGISEDVLADLQIAADEILSNIIKYAYPDSKQHTITVRLSFPPNEVTMEFIDSGFPFDPRNAPRPAIGKGLRNRHIGGLGIHFVKALMDGIEYVRDDGRNHLCLRKKCVTAVKQEGEKHGR
jgi:anti-sigma regulatory factor (Ser/Thr protein kinase)